VTSSACSRSWDAWPGERGVSDHATSISDCRSRCRPGAIRHLPPPAAAVRIRPQRFRQRVVKAFHQRLIDAGKPKLVALVAVARKLLTIRNAIIRSGQAWQSEAQAASI
jgi:hypothetical protein